MRKTFFVILSLFAVSTCAMSYEYFLGAMASYLLGDGKIQWALTITTMMVAMGVGGYCSRYVVNYEKTVLHNELFIAIIGGFSTLGQYIINVYIGAPRSFTLVYIFLNGLILGFQIPLFMHIIREQKTNYKETIAEVTLFDFLGAVPAVILYIYLIKEVGMVKGAMFVGLINIATVFLGLYIFKEKISSKHRKILYGITTLVLILLIGGITYGEQAVLGLEQKLYSYRIIYKEQSSFQKIVMTREKDDTRLFLNGNLQFSSNDEYRYHEALVHPAMGLADSRENILVLGGGDGLAVREILKYQKQVKNIILVDIDPAVTRLSQENELIKELNNCSLSDEKVDIINEDAMQFLRKDTNIYDVIFIDLPDPNNEALAKLYTKEFYNLCRKRLSAAGKLAVQSTSPYFCREVFWTVVNTVKNAGFNVLPYHVYVPSFGDWGFTLASHNKIHKEMLNLEVPTKYLQDEILTSIFKFAKDEKLESEVVNTLIKPEIMDMYLKAWNNW